VDLLASGTVVESTTADRQGRFRLTARPGHYQIVAHNVGYASRAEKEIILSRATDVTLVVDSGLR
jgi:hypothetical protein